jgi:hypothetical protein
MASHATRLSWRLAHAAILAPALAWAAPAQDDSRPSLDLTRVEAEMEKHRSASAAAKGAIARYKARQQHQSAAAAHAAKLTNADIRTPGDSLIAGQLLVDADRGREAVPHLVNGLKGTPGGLTPWLKLFEASTKPLPKTDLTKPIPEKAQALAAAALELSENAKQGVTSLRITGMFGMAFKNVTDEPTFVLLVNEARRIFGKSEPLGVPWAGAAITPLGLMAIRGMPPEKVASLGRSYCDLLAPDRRRYVEKAIGPMPLT